MKFSVRVCGFFVSMWPCGRLATCPGCTYCLSSKESWDRLLQIPTTPRLGITKYKQWMYGWTGGNEHAYLHPYLLWAVWQRKNTRMLNQITGTPSQSHSSVSITWGRAQRAQLRDKQINSMQNINSTTIQFWVSQKNVKPEMLNSKLFSLE